MHDITRLPEQLTSNFHSRRASAPVTRSHAGPPVISDSHHPAIAAVHALRDRAERDRTQRYFLDGLRFVFQAVEARIPLEQVVVSPELLSRHNARALIRDIERAGVPIVTVTPAVYRALSLAESPQGLGAIAHQQWHALPAIKPTRGLCWIALDTVHSAGNLGTILRTSDAVGGAGLILLGDTTDPYDPATVRATMGALLFQQFVRTTPSEFAAWKRRTGALLVGTSPSATKDYRALTYPRPLVLWMGPERQGLSDEQQASCDVVVKIPMVGRSDSLNLAIATSVMLYEIFNQRQGTGKRGRR
jgi:TrmH family RNA methyltransferase